MILISTTKYIYMITIDMRSTGLGSGSKHWVLAPHPPPTHQRIKGRQVVAAKPKPSEDVPAHYTTVQNSINFGRLDRLEK